MKNIVFLNAARLDFDNKLDFSVLERIGNFTKYPASSDEEILNRVQNKDIVITKELPISSHMINQFPASVKLICEAGTGYNNIDIAAARERNIAVCNVPSYSTEAVAQLAITFILNFCSSMNIQQTMIKQGNYDNFTRYLQVPHFEIQKKTLGVIGAGAIGQQVIRIASVMGMNILVYSRTPKLFNDPNVKFVSLDELLMKSDFISIHCPLSPDTKHLINKEKLRLMKPSAYIINTSRGAIIKESDLIEALQNGIIAGAALDVQDPEPPELDNPLFKMRNVILSPHIGWKCLETRQRLVCLLAESIEAFINGKLINMVN
jgi:glycerate dehydrogenase